MKTNIPIIELLEKVKNKTIKAINRNIRICLSLIAQKSFVAYTATPYAVVSQRSEGIEREWEIDNVKYVPVKKANETTHDVKNAITPKT